MKLARLLFYAVLALLMYVVALAFGSGAAFAFFLITGFIGELAFWRELFFKRKET